MVAHTFVLKANFPSTSTFSVERQVILRLIKAMQDEKKNNARRMPEPVKVLDPVPKLNDHLAPLPSVKKTEKPMERLHTAQGPRRVHWALRNQTPVSSQAQRPYTAGSTVTVAELRSEFDIFPDWRAPLRQVVPMTQVPYRARRRKVLLANEGQEVYYHPLRREFTIHPEWSTP